MSEEKLPSTPPGEPPFPGSAPTVSGTTPHAFVVGRFAVCTLGGSIIANMFDWEINFNFDFADATSHGDHWKIRQFLDGDWTARARGYVTIGTAATYLKSYTASSVPPLLTFIGYEDGPPSPAIPIFQGQCYLQKGRISVPMTMVEQEIELISSGAPTVGLS